MVHFAGYTPRFHPSDFETRTRDGVGADWPISYEELQARTTSSVERELPVAGQDWPWGDPHRYPHAPHPLVRRAPSAPGRARAPRGIEMRVGPVAITNGTFGNRPHCIYRGFCLQGCKVNAKASPLVTHLPDAIEHGVEVRADSHGRRASRSTRPGALHRRDATCATGASASSAPPPSRSPATRSRRRGCCCTRPARASRTGSATTTTRSAAT